jgi:hypothetical protein
VARNDWPAVLVGLQSTDGVQPSVKVGAVLGEGGADELQDGFDNWNSRTQLGRRG